MSRKSSLITSNFSVYVLDEMEKAGFVPSLIVTTPDKPKGRALALTATEVKIWGSARGIPVLDPAALDETTIDLLKKICSDPAAPIDVFVVAAYGKIIPEAVLSIPPHQTLNIHPSLLPAYRGAAPLQSAMLDDSKKTGVTIMRIDELMDHGPIVAQKEIRVDEWPPYEIFEENMAREGARLLVEILPKWILGQIKETEQDHAKATFTRKIKKEDGLIDINNLNTPHNQNDASVSYDIFRKIQAYHRWPTSYFFITKDNTKDGEKSRIKITKASWRDSALIIEKVIPEGKAEIDFNTFIKNNPL